MPIHTTFQAYSSGFEHDYIVSLFIKESEKHQFNCIRKISIEVEKLELDKLLKTTGLSKMLFHVDYINMKKKNIETDSGIINGVTSPLGVTDGEDYISAEIRNDDHEILARNDDIIAHIRVTNMTNTINMKTNPYIFFSISANSDEKLEKITEILAKLHVEKETKQDNIKVSFVSLSESGYTSGVREIEAPLLDEIIQNYNADTLESVNSLKDNIDNMSGKLLLFHGEPGTGKTYMIRALSRFLKNKCDLYYVLDPECFFNDMKYMNSLILDGVTTSVENQKYKLIILEDADEFITEDAKNRTGQALSRLLNISDGFIGQGLKIIFLITTNEPFNKIHKALSREGRCAAIIKFNKLNKEESMKWLKEKSAEKQDITKDMILADLYSMINKKRIGSNEMKERKVGF